jgi:hypothetical protein
MRKLLARGTCVAVLVAASTVASASPVVAGESGPITYTFVGLGDGTTWNDQMNWSPQGIPHFGDSVVIKQNPGGPSHVTEAKTTQLATITIGPGGSLKGEPLYGAQVQWSGGTIFNDITVITALQVTGDATKILQGTAGDPQSGRITVQDKALLTGEGELRMIRGTIVNQGEFVAVGPPGTVAYVNGNFGGPALGTFENHGYVTAMEGAELHLENFALDSPDTLGGGSFGLSGGRVRVSGGTVHLPTNAEIADEVVFTDGSVVTADGVVLLGADARMSLEGSTSTTLAGTPVFSGPGQVEWRAATVTGKVELTSGVTMTVDGTGLKVLNNKSTGPMLVSPGAFVVQRGTGPLRLGVGAEIVNQGQWLVQESDASIGGATCCVSGSVGLFRNMGTVAVQQGRTLVMGTGPGVVGMDYTQEPTGSVLPNGAVGGRLVLSGGVTRLHGGIITGVAVDLVGNGTASVDGTVNVHTGATLRQTDGTDLTASGTLGGAGRYRWSDGTITGRLVTGAALHVDVDDPATGAQDKRLLPGATQGGLLDVRGPLRIDTAKPVVLASTSSKVSSLVLGGATAWRRGTLDYAGVAGSLRNTGSLTVSPGLSTRLALVNDGRLRLAARGALSVGSFRQGGSGRLTLVVAGKRDTSRDRILSAGPLQLGGRLTVSHQGSGKVGRYALLTGSARTSTFGRVKLRRLPGYAVTYRPTSVLLGH